MTKHERPPEANSLPEHKVEINGDIPVINAATLRCTEEGAFIYDQTGEPADRIARTFSQAKFGDRKAISQLAVDITSATIANPLFETFINDAQDHNTNIYITSPGFYNIPIASTLLMQEVAERLNIYLSKNNYPTVIVDTTVSDSMVETPQPTYPGHNLLYVEDGTFGDQTLQANVHELAEKYQTKKILVLAGVHVSLDEEQDQLLVEDLLTRHKVTGSLSSLKRILNQEHFVAINKPLRFLLNPENREELYPFLSENVPESNLIKLYIAASHYNFRGRNNGMFIDSVNVLEQVLKEKGWIDQDGNLMTIPKLAGHIERRRIVVEEIDSRKDITSEAAILYSQMKYGEPKATNLVATHMFESIMANENFQKAVTEGKRIVVTSSAFGEVPTAAYALTTRIIKKLEEVGIEVTPMKVNRSGDFATTNYGKLSAQERTKKMHARKLSLSPENTQLCENAFVLVVDDVSVTGSHEAMMNEVLQTTNAAEISYVYYMNFSEFIAIEEPETEEFLNTAFIQTIEDLSHFLDPDSGEIQINARTLKFILETAYAGDEAEESLRAFCDKLPLNRLRSLYIAATSKDGYSKMPKFTQGIKLLERSLLDRRGATVETINQQNNRTVAWNITLKDDHWYDMQTGMEATELVHRYSRMKYGNPDDIKYFSNIFAQKILQNIHDDRHPIHTIFINARERNEHVVLMTPAYRGIPSSSNLLLSRMIGRINHDLALDNFPTILDLRISRHEITSPTTVFASREVRNKQMLSYHPILPGEYLYSVPTHVIFADNIRISGSSSLEIEREALSQGALSFSSWFIFQVDPRISFNHPNIEHKLSESAITEGLGKEILEIANHPEFTPVQRLVRIIFESKNKQYVRGFFHNVQDDSLKELYIAILMNEGLKNPDFKDSISILQNVLHDRGLIDEAGRLHAF